MVIGASWVVQWWFEVPEVVILLRIFGVLVPVHVLFHLQSALMQGMQRQWAFGLIQTLPQQGFALLALLIFSLWERDIRLPGAAMAVSVCLTGIVAYWVFRGIWRGMPLGADTVVGEMSDGALLGVAWPMFMTASAYLVMNWTDTVMIGLIHDETEVGLYSVAMRWALFVPLLLSAVNVIITPKMAACYGRGDARGLREVVQQSARLISIGSLVVALPLVVFPGWFLGWFGGVFTSASTALIFLVLGTLINALCGPVGSVLNMTGGERSFRNTVVLATGINLILNLILVPRYGIEGAAFASMIAVGLYNILGVFQVKRRLGFYPLWIPFQGASSWR
ncbi:MAG: polysaccharide biosynthesis C-terminal domain-containing protein [Magnetococcales bacterium]|nr:polysaccharide biosynthesis C-terminal domain-containing protein [Magnetococcales bacterium]